MALNAHSALSSAHQRISLHACLVEERQALMTSHICASIEAEYMHVPLQGCGH